MKERIVNFETAKVAKQKGFDWKIKGCYRTKDGKLFDAVRKNSKDLKTMVTAPTQSLLQKWIREEHHIHIGISYDWITYDVLIDHPDIKPIKLISMVSEGSEYTFTEYEEALEKGLIKALTLIKN